MDDETWHLGKIFEAWDQIHRALYEAMSPLPPQTLAFLAERASDRIIRDKAAGVLDDLAGEDEDAAAKADEWRRLFRREPW